MLRSRSAKARISAVETAASELADAVDGLRFAAPVALVYNPLRYAWALHRAYIRAFAGGRKRVVFLGMNPGPFGMGQTGVPFGDPTVVREWLKLDGPITKPPREHPKRPVLGLASTRNEVSGTRLWGAIARHWRTPSAFFADHYIANYCPLLFLEASARNLTPDKLSVGDKTRLFAACDRHLGAVIDALEPEWVVTLGVFAEHQARAALAERKVKVKIARILHPSPANPLANRDWAGIVTAELQTLGICRRRPATGH
ncbi:MAG: single-stranded DNA-binding protein [Myxococcales bacterium]|nr:single-stranded DNA-binding protein [Myxococcales bacterium]